MSEYGICPAARDTSLDGMNQGKSGGRACWAISGTLCEGKVQGTFAVKLSDCKQCSFFKLVLMQQGGKLQDTREIRRALLLTDLKRHVGEKYKDHLNLKIRPLRGRWENLPKVNCWEFMECGREPGGEFVDELGVCRYQPGQQGGACLLGSIRNPLSWPSAGRIWIERMRLRKV
ncbi:MAG: hypothetical protein JRI78_08720 [Deltaproteobacteria bacterium]|nr:hypothetical protein [Deltaproteobacteria bacterium]